MAYNKAPLPQGPDLRNACSNCWVLSHPAVLKVPDTSKDHTWGVSLPGALHDDEPFEGTTDVYSSDDGRLALCVGVILPRLPGVAWDERGNAGMRACRAADYPSDTATIVSKNRICCPGGLYLIDRVSADADSTEAASMSTFEVHGDLGIGPLDAEPKLIDPSALPAVLAPAVTSYRNRRIV